MLRGYAHAIITTPNLYDPLVQLQLTKIVAFFIRGDLPAFNTSPLITSGITRN
jgi:hypothetical protein